MSSLVIDNKFLKLKETLGELSSAAIGFSGGVDSTFLAAVAYDVLADKVCAFTAVSSSYPKREREESITLAKQIGIRQIFFDSEEVDIPEFENNPPDRCYHCKKELYSKLEENADKEGYKTILDASNLDDDKDFRPGRKALKELKVRSPLKEVGLTKDEIRELSKRMNLPTWDKPAFACLSSRFQYGDKITREKLGKVEQAEEFLRDQGFRILRVRDHGNMLRIEVGTNEISRFLDSDFRQKVVTTLKRVGYDFISLDLEGYRTGSMNEVLTENEINV